MSSVSHPSPPELEPGAVDEELITDDIELPSEASNPGAPGVPLFPDPPDTDFSFGLLS